MGFSNSFELFRQALKDRCLDSQALSNMVDVSVASLKALEENRYENISTAALARIAKALKLPTDSLLREDNNSLHRMVSYQDFITPRGFDAWIDTLSRFTQVSLLTSTQVVPELRAFIEEQIKIKTLAAYRKGQITQGRAKELLNLTAWDSLPED